MKPPTIFAVTLRLYVYANWSLFCDPGPSTPFGFQGQNTPKISCDHSIGHTKHPECRGVWSRILNRMCVRSALYRGVYHTRARHSNLHCCVHALPGGLVRPHVFPRRLTITHVLPRRYRVLEGGYNSLPP